MDHQERLVTPGANKMLHSVLHMPDACARQSANLPFLQVGAAHRCLSAPQQGVPNNNHLPPYLPGAGGQDKGSPAACGGTSNALRRLHSGTLQQLQLLHTSALLHEKVRALECPP
ncbi:Homeobox-DDT domain protein RLT2, partial [Varanus komodoensis]